ncbi:MAG: class I tRNA ligase family protein, partial [Candidatus Bathyarchaeota archaeon]|nr:class I tRNA ligase family protein [Candidatus Bathyarchaeota archaeon]
MELNLPKEEKKILKFWQDSEVFQKSLKKRKKRPAFVFYDGPITVNAKPGIHHILSRIFKDLIPRYKTMKGYYVVRKNGWDTHGLPVELEVEKKLGFSSKKDIEEYGIARFNRECKKNVQKYIPIFKNLTERIGYWVDMENPYITYDNRYIESLWWTIKQIWKKKLLYEDFKVVPWCPRCGTSLSSHEVALGYKNIKENSIYVKFQTEREKNTYFLVWTTTPWTLPSNAALAISPRIQYVKVEYENDQYILAKNRVADVFKDRPFKVIEHMDSNTLLEKYFYSEPPGYKPPFPEFYYRHAMHIKIQRYGERGGAAGIEWDHEGKRNELEKKGGWNIYWADFVTDKEGTGIVHIAPGFGPDDMELANRSDIPRITRSVNEQGRFTKAIKPWKGMHVKDADPLIIEDLKKRNLILKEEIHKHDYPFCWRCHSPLLYYANPKKSWFIKVTKIKDKLIENNKSIEWVPSHIKKGRFGGWLEEVKDWAFSRERYWGTPLPVWRCGNCENTEVIGSKEDLKKQKFSNNRYFVMRHALSLKNTKFIINALPNEKYPLVKIGKFQAKRVAKRLKKLLDGQKLEVIFSSDLMRGRQTAEIIATELGSTAEMKIDKELRDINHGEWEGKSLLKFKREFLDSADKLFFEAPEGGEDWLEVRKRMMRFI